MRFTRRDLLMTGAGAGAMLTAFAVRRHLYFEAQAKPPPISRPYECGKRPYCWTLLTETAGYPAMDGPGALSFRGRMWLLGGWNPALYEAHTHSEVWSSADGKQWRREPDAPWSPRHTAGYAVHDGRMWVVGGDATGGVHVADVWWTQDGQTWTRATERAPWGPRAFHYVAAFDGYLWVFGGQTRPDQTGVAARFYGDAWRSKDGATWEKVADNLPWAPRGMICGAAVLHDRIWILGGGTFESRAFQGRQRRNDVWSSSDGIAWEKVAAITPWQPRSYHNVAAWDGRLWVIAGHDASPRGRDGNLGDVWFSEDGKSWTELAGTPWLPRHAAALFVHGDALFIAAGVVTWNLHDVWRLTRNRRPLS